MKIVTFGLRQFQNQFYFQRRYQNGMWDFSSHIFFFKLSTTSLHLVLNTGISLETGLVLDDSRRATFRAE